MLKVIGLMSGTSLDGIDVALIETDGERVLGFGPAMALAYSPEERAILKAALDAAAGMATRGNERPQELDRAERLVTEKHAEAVKAFIAGQGLSEGEVALVGFHGQTVLHRPKDQWTVQLGMGEDLARTLGIPVAFDFRTRDVAAGGEGAPLVPLYHQALAETLRRPGEALAILNIGGVANVTYLDAQGGVLAFDTGPGNAPIDDWVMRHLGVPVDANGAHAARGRVDETIVARLLLHPWFQEAPPKSLDRQDFTSAPVEGLSLEDGAATLTAFTAASVAAARAHMAAAPARWIVCGGGRHNPSLMKALRDYLNVSVEPCDVVGWRGDFIEAEAFAFLAARAMRGLPLSLPTTTGVPEPMPGGRIATPD
ncbi:MAG: anhydro-N-acetylmuramic acid kinase [Alphaproteobacteria bacterium]|nr:anhydro-N-acetylmuramic acid kinase [Alphaproteobacteria bacterium]